MAKTLANLEAQTRTYLDEASTDDWTDVEVDREINAGYQEIVTSVVETYEDFYIQTANFDSIADQQEYTTVDGIPSDIFKIRRLEINYDVSDAQSNPKYCRPVLMDAVLRDLGNSALGITVYRNPAFFFYGSGTGAQGQRIGVIPEPTKAGTDAFKLWYIPYVADMTSGTDAINIPYPDRYAKLVSLYASAQLLRKGQQEEVVASNYMAEFEIGLEKMKQQLEDRLALDSKEITDTLGLGGDFTH